MLTAMRSYACWTSNKTNHMNAPVYVSVLGTLCTTHIYMGKQLHLSIYHFLSRQSFNEYPMPRYVWRAKLSYAFFTLSLQSQPEKNLSTRIPIFARNSLHSMCRSPGVTNQDELIKARYYRQVIHVLRCDAKYSGRKVPCLLSTFSYIFRVANPSILKNAASDPSEILLCF